MPDTPPKNILSTIERVQGKISSLQAENNRLRSMLELGVSEEGRAKAAGEISLLKEDKADTLEGQEKQLSRSEANVQTAQPRKTKMKWYSPKSVAGLANDGFLSIIRSTGKAVGLVQFSATSGFSKIDQALFPQKKEKKPQKLAPEPAKSNPAPMTEENQAQEEAAPEVTVVIHERENEMNSEPPESEPSPVIPEKLPDSEKTGDTVCSPMNLEELLEHNLPRDKIEAIKLRNAVDDLLHGSEASCLRALETLVGFGPVAEPFLIASLQTGSPQVAEIALKSLNQIGSERFMDCISDLLASSDPALRIVALRVAQRLPEDQARPILERGLRDPSAKVKRRVISYLSWCCSPWALTEIRRLCDDPDTLMKWAALEALLTVRPSEAYDNLELMIPHLPPAYQRRAATLLQQRKINE